MQNTMGRVLVFFLVMGGLGYVFGAPLAEQAHGIDTMTRVLEMPKLRSEAQGVAASINPILPGYIHDREGRLTVVIPVSFVDDKGVSVTMEGALTGTLIPADIPEDSQVMPTVVKRRVAVAVFELKDQTGGAVPALWYMNLVFMLPEGESDTGFDIKITYTPPDGIEEDVLEIEAKAMIPAPVPDTPKK